MQNVYSFSFTEKCPLKCLNNGKCIVEDEKAVCNCTEGFTGATCEIRKCDIRRF